MASGSADGRLWPRRSWAARWDGGGVTGQRRLARLRAGGDESVASLRLGEHEVDERLPAGEIQIAGQGLHIVEEGLAGGEFNPHAAVRLVTQIEGGVKQEC